MTSRKAESILLPLAVFAGGLALWALVWEAHLFHQSALPSPVAVLHAFGAEIRNGRMLNDLSTSLFRVTIGFLIAVALGIPWESGWGTSSWRALPSCRC